MKFFFNTSMFKIGYMCLCGTLFAKQKVVEYNLVFSFLPIDSSANEKGAVKTVRQARAGSPPYSILNLNVCTSHMFMWGILFKVSNKSLWLLTSGLVVYSIQKMNLSCQSHTCFLLLGTISRAKVKI